eukprot:gene4884-5727_t
MFDLLRAADALAAGRGSGTDFALLAPHPIVVVELLPAQFVRDQRTPDNALALGKGYLWWTLPDEATAFAAPGARAAEALYRAASNVTPPEWEEVLDAVRAVLCHRRLTA